MVEKEKHTNKIIALLYKLLAETQVFFFGCQKFFLIKYSACIPPPNRFI